MGQYWIPVNLDKKEYLDPHKLGTGLKLWEQVANHPGTGTALLILCAAQPVMRGGGDLSLDTGREKYDELAASIIGRWAGDRIALVGDYAEQSDLPPEYDADQIYGSAFCDDTEIGEILERLQVRAQTATADEQIVIARQVRALLQRWTDISDAVATVIEYELSGTYSGDGWRTWTPDKSGE